MPDILVLCSFMLLGLVAGNDFAAACENPRSGKLVIALRALVAAVTIWLSFTVG